MISWVYIFSQFTGEALTLEIVAFLLLFCSYTGYWVIKKRRFGVIDSEMPSGPVKFFLSELIADAEQLRTQLFGLQGKGQQTATRSAPPVGSVPLFSSSPDLGDLDKKIREQAQAIENLNTQKSALEKELAEAKARMAQNPGKPNEQGSELVQKLQEQIRALEEKLAEYSIIEDDLANLKRLQQENILLRNALNEKGIPLPQPPTPPPAGTSPPPPSIPPKSEAPSPKSEPEPVAAAPVPAPAPPVKATEPETSLPQDDGQGPEITASASQPLSIPEPTEEPEPKKSSNHISEKDEAELVAEFEKMLKG